jgi:hypothetical protein
MTEVTTTIPTSDDAGTTRLISPPPSTDFRRRRRWALWVGAVTIVVVGSLWYGLSRDSGPTVSATVADCSDALGGATATSPTTNLQPLIVGLGSVASIAAFETPSGPAWCFDGMGTGGDGISQAAMHSALDAPVAVVDGALNSDVLMLVHLGPRTTSVVVTTAGSHSNVLARGDGFEVLRIPMKWPKWHAPWPRGPVALGRIIGFDHQGRVTSSQAFTWCPGSINISPGTGC